MLVAVSLAEWLLGDTSSRGVEQSGHESGLDAARISRDLQRFGNAGDGHYATVKVQRYGSGEMEWR